MAAVIPVAGTTPHEEVEEDEDEVGKRVGGSIEHRAEEGDKSMDGLLEAYVSEVVGKGKDDCPA